LGIILIPANQGFFRGSIGFLNMALGVLFIVKGVKGRKKACASDADAPADSPITKVPENMRHTVILLGTVATGFLTGLIGIGGGMNYVLLIMIFMGIDVLKACGSGMVSTAASTLVAAIGILVQLPPDPTMLWFALALATVAAVATAIALKFTNNLPENSINLLIGVIVLIASITASIQAVFVGQGAA
jgi:uncharacterized membrane protein YfcA